MQHESTLKAILDNSIESIVFISPKHQVVSFNKSIQETLFLYHGKLLQEGDDYRDFVIPSNRKAYDNTFAKAIKGETIIIQNESKEGAICIWFEYIMNPVYGEASELLGVTLTARNIDGQKKVEIEMEQMIETIDAVFENTTEIIVLIDPEFNLLRFNKAAAKTIKRQRNQVAALGDDFSGFINGEGQKKFFKIFYKALKGEASIAKIQSTNYKGAPAWFKVRMQPVYKKKKELLGVSMFATNITEKRLAQISLKEKEQKLKEIAWNQSHIIRTPVVKILGIVNIIKEYPELDVAEQKEWIDQLLVTTVELDNVIKEIVSLTDSKAQIL